MNYKKWLIEDLQNLNRDRFAITQLAESIKTVEAEFSAIRATDYDKVPGNAGGNIQEEKMLTAIAKLDELQANLEYTKKHVSDMDRLLDQLPDDERQIIERMVINQEKYGADTIAQDLGFERRQIYNKKNAALNHLARLRHGASFQT